VEPGSVTSEPRRRAGLGRTAPVALFATVVPITSNVLTLVFGPLIAAELRGTGVKGAIAFAVVYALLGAFSIGPTYTTSVIAGWAFGARLGIVTMLAGTIGSALLCYAVAKRFATERVTQAFREHPRWDAVRHALAEEHSLKTLWIVFLLRLSPILPFGTTNILLAASGVRLPIYLLGTIVGMVPRIGAIVIAAAGANQLDFKRKESWWFLAAGIAATIVCIAVMAMIGKRALDRATNQAE
jgi:uncharacterized membrane protein YdjX (TVP38/TMEM64 family)